MPLTPLSPDRYFLAGLAAMQHQLSFDMGVRIKLRALYFPNMRYLLAWSKNPLLHADGIVLVVGSERIISLLRGIVDPRHVLLSPGGESLPALTERLCEIIRLRENDSKAYRKDIFLTSREMAYMWAFIRGEPVQSNSKRDSCIRRTVMKKIGAENQLALLIRFRLLFFLDSHYLLKHARMRKSKISESRRRQTRWLYLQELRDVATQQVFK